MSHGVCSRSQDGLCIWKHSRLGGGVEDQVGERDQLSSHHWLVSSSMFVYICTQIFCPSYPFLLQIFVAVLCVRILFVNWVRS